MTIEQAVMEKLRRLSPDKQKQALALIDALEPSGAQPSAKLRSPRGLWAGLGFDVTEGDIDEIRKEMWSNFPREDVS